MKLTRIAAIGAAVTFLGGAAEAQEVLKLGVLSSLSGSAATWGLAMKGAAELAAEDVNKTGGLEVGGKKYRVQVVAYDDQYKSSEAITAMNRMISEDGIKYVVGPAGSAPAVAILPITTAAKVVTMTLAFTDKATSTEAPYSFRSVIPTTIFAKPQATWVVNKVGAKKVAGLFPNDETGQQLARDTEAAWSAAGGRFVSKEFFEREKTDFTPLLTRIIASDADVIELDGNTPQAAGLIVKQARELGWDKAIVRSGGDATADILAIAGRDLAEGVYVHQPVDPALPATKDYADRWAKTYKTDMNGFSPFFYSNVQLLFEAMKQAGTVTDSEKVKVAMEGIKDFPTALGKTGWTGQALFGINHQLDAPYYIAQIRKGKAEIVARCAGTTCE